MSAPSDTRKSRRNKPQGTYTEETLPYPDGPPVEEGHFNIEEYCLVSADHVTLGTVDNLLVHCLFSSQNNRRVQSEARARRAVLPDKFPESFDVVSTLPREFRTSLHRFISHVIDNRSPRQDWHGILNTIRFTWLCAFNEDEQRNLTQLLMSDLFEWTLFRYIPLKCNKRVGLRGVMFEGSQRRQCGIIATTNLSKDTTLWELNGILSMDEVEGPSFSTILPHSCQNMPSKGPRIMVGPARFVNHCCSPNALVRFVSSFRCRRLNRATSSLLYRLDPYSSFD